MKNIFDLVRLAQRIGAGKGLRTPEKAVRPREVGKPAAVVDKATPYKYRYKRLISDDEMVRLYTKEEHTLDSIGTLAGLTRERVRQILQKHGITAKDNARAVIRASQKARQTKKENRYLPFFGCSQEELMHIGSHREKGTPSYFFKAQKNNARARKIPWQMTLTEWLDVWQKSGKLSQRGVGRGRYVMARIADQGAYAVDNVVIITHEENSREARQMDVLRGRWKTQKK